MKVWVLIVLIVGVCLMNSEWLLNVFDCCSDTRDKLHNRDRERERDRAALNDECGTVMDETEDGLKAQETLWLLERERNASHAEKERWKNNAGWHCECRINCLRPSAVWSYLIPPAASTEVFVTVILTGLDSQRSWQLRSLSSLGSLRCFWDLHSAHVQLNPGSIIVSAAALWCFYTLFSCLK